MTTLSTRLAAATEMTPELREECARMLGWAKNLGLIGMPWERFDGDYEGLCEPPQLDLTEIVAEIERRKPKGILKSSKKAFGLLLCSLLYPYCLSHWLSFVVVSRRSICSKTQNKALAASSAETSSGQSPSCSIPAVIAQRAASIARNRFFVNRIPPPPHSR